MRFSVCCSSGTTTSLQAKRNKPTTTQATAKLTYEATNNEIHVQKPRTTRLREPDHCAAGAGSTGQSKQEYEVALYDPLAIAQISEIWLWVVNRFELI